MTLYDKACAVLNGSARENLLMRMPLYCEFARLQAIKETELPRSTALSLYDAYGFMDSYPLPFLPPLFNLRLDITDQTVYVCGKLGDVLDKDTGPILSAIPFATGAGMGYKAWGIAMWIDGEDSMVVVSKLAELIGSPYVLYLEDVEYMCPSFIITKDTVWFNAADFKDS